MASKTDAAATRGNQIATAVWQWLEERQKVKLVPWVENPTSGDYDPVAAADMAGYKRCLGDLRDRILSTCNDLDYSVPVSTTRKPLGVFVSASQPTAYASHGCLSGNYWTAQVTEKSPPLGGRTLCASGRILHTPHPFSLGAGAIVVLRDPQHDTTLAMGVVFTRLIPSGDGHADYEWVSNGIVRGLQLGQTTYAGDRYDIFPLG